MSISIETVLAKEYENWKDLLGLELKNYSLIDEKGYCHSAILLEFENKIVIEIKTNDDSLVMDKL